MLYSVKEKIYISVQSKNIRNKQDKTSTLLNVALAKVTVHARNKAILRPTTARCKFAKRQEFLVGHSCRTRR